MQVSFNLLTFLNQKSYILSYEIRVNIYGPMKKCFGFRTIDHSSVVSHDDDDL